MKIGVVRIRSLSVAMLAALACLSNITAQAGSVTEWRIDASRSKLGFVAFYDNIPFTATFKKFSARIFFDSTALDQSSFEATVDIRSVDSDSPDRDEGMLEKAWFDTEQYPIATFTTSSFKTGGNSNQFRADGRLSIKGTAQEVTLPFTWDLIDKTKQTARLTGELPLRRTDFSIGSGEWATDDTIGFNVKVLIELYLQPVQ